MLVQVGQIEDKVSPQSRGTNVLEAWNTVEEHDKQPQRFKQLCRTHRGNTLYCRTKRDDLVAAAVIQRVKMSMRYSPAQHDISSENNRVMYTLVQMLGKHAPQGSGSREEKHLEGM